MSDQRVLCLVNGPWQAISLVASLAQLELTPQNSVIDVLLVDMLEESDLHGATTRVLRANGFERLHTIDRRESPRGIGRRLGELELVLGRPWATVSLLATFGVHRPIARYVLNTLPSVRVHVYEEGLRAYLPQGTNLRARATARFARVWGRVDPHFGRAWTPPRDQAAYSYGFLLSGLLAPPSYASTQCTRGVQIEHVRDALSALPEPVVRGLPDRPYVVIVGQYYARLAQMEQREELDAYTAVARAIVDRGFVPIWRGHIREQDVFLALLRQRCPSLRAFAEFVDDPSLPLERYQTVFADPRCRGAVAFSSSSLFYLRQLHGVETGTMVTPAMLEKMTHPHRDACLLAQRHLPSVAASLGARA